MNIIQFLITLILFFTGSACPSCGSTTPDPPQGPTPGINISRQEYESALAKWQAAGVREYEIVVSYSQPYSDSSGMWTLRVRGDKVEVVNRLSESVPVTPEPDVSGDKLKFLTISAIFAQIKDALDDPYVGTIRIGDNRYGAVYTVQFDDTLGYPNLFAINPIYITDNDSQIRVVSLKVLVKRET